jgi:protein-disulfide isomerase
LKWDNLFTAVLVGCALVTTGVVVKREFFAPVDNRSKETPPRFIADWRSKLDEGDVIGSAGAPVQIIEFGDFECPFCGTYHATLRTIREHHPGKVAVTFVHFPIRGHRFALPAARVAECAAIQGRFEEIYDTLYNDQESLGLKPWTDYASRAGITDILGFEKCNAETGPLDRVDGGKRLGTEWDVKGTPTVVVNGWMFSQPPSADELDSMVKNILAGKSPLSAGGGK